MREFVEVACNFIFAMMWNLLAGYGGMVSIGQQAYFNFGGYFAIGTWVIAEVFRLSFANVSAVGGGSGTALTALRGIEKATRESATYWMALACVVAAIALVSCSCAASAASLYWRSVTTKWQLNRKVFRWRALLRR